MVGPRHLGREPWYDHDQRLAGIAPGKAHDMRAALADRLERTVRARQTELGSLISQVEPARGDPHLDSAVRPLPDHLGNAGAAIVAGASWRKQWLHRLEQSPPMRKVDGPAIVW